MAAPLDIITGAMQDLGAIALEETPTNGEAQAGLNALNNLLETWSNENLIIYDTSPQVYPLVQGKISYTFGPGGDTSTTRPITISQAYLRDINGYDLPIPDVSTNYADYANAPNKTTNNGGYPFLLYDDSGFPLKTIYLYPVPNSANYVSLVLWTQTVLGNLTNLQAQITMPPGYARALQKNLALEIAPAYGRAVSPELMRQAMNAKEVMQRKNFNMNQLQYRFGGGRYDIQTNRVYVTQPV